MRACSCREELRSFGGRNQPAVMTPKWILLPCVLGLLLDVSVFSQQSNETQQGTVTLESGTAPGTGNVLIFYNGKLWSVCDDGWNLAAARVVCRSLGYPHALGHTSQSYFGRPRHGKRLLICRFLHLFVSGLCVQCKFICVLVRLGYLSFCV